MIPEEDAKKLREKFSEMKKEVKVQFFNTPNCEICNDVHKLIVELSELADGKVILEDKPVEELPPEYKESQNGPIIILGDNGEVVYYGSPVGHEAWAFVETIVLLGSEDSGLKPEHREMLKEISKKLYLETVITPTCPYCPYAVLYANQVAIETKGLVRAEMVNAWEFQELATQYNVNAVPVTVFGREPHAGKVEFVGVPKMEDLIEKVLEYTK